MSLVHVSRFGATGSSLCSCVVANWISEGIGRGGRGGRWRGATSDCRLAHDGHGLAPKDEWVRGGERKRHSVDGEVAGFESMCSKRRLRLSETKHPLGRKLCVP